MSARERLGARDEARAGPDGGLAITDQRTGQSYELPIRDGALRATDLSEIEGEPGLGLLSYDPAWRNTASCRSAITYVGGEEGILQYRGYSIEDLVEHSTYLEVAYLLVHGELPTEAQYAGWVHNITVHRFVHENVRRFLQGFRHDAPPMGILLSAVGALSTFFQDANEIDDPQNRFMQAIRLIAKMPTLAAFAYRHANGRPYVYPDDELSYTGNFLSMVHKMTELKYRPDPRLERALDVLFILHADHEQSCSTSAVRGVGSARVDPYSAVAAGLAALYGPPNGAANQAVLRMLRQIGRKERIPDFIAEVKTRQVRLMGFGHRAYRSYDPRARIMKSVAEEVFAATGERDPLLDLALELEKVALEDRYFIEHKLFPNIDYYSGLIYKALGIPEEMFPVMFAIPRASGWIAQWLELVQDPEQTIARPRQIYTGARDRSYVSLEQR